MNILLTRNKRVDLYDIRAKSTKWMATDFYEFGWKERSYQGLKPQIMVEEFLGDGITLRNDYKFYVFNGRVGTVQVDEDRFTDHRTNMFDIEFNRIKTKSRHPASGDIPKSPSNLGEMIEIAQKIAAELPFARVDLYSVRGKVYFGEVTPYPEGGVIGLRPARLIGQLGKCG